MAKTARLAKTAASLNISMDTAIDFLKSKNMDIDNPNPNSKLTPEQLELLNQEFLKDKKLKEETKSTSVQKEEKKTISLKKEEKEEKQIQVEEKEIVLEEKEEETVPPIEEKSEHTVKEEKEKSEGKVNIPGVKVVDKIDLDKLNLKTKPSKKKKDESKETPKKEEEVIGNVKPETTDNSEEIKLQKQDEEVSKTETIKAKSEKLKGVTVTRKIELPVDSEKERKKEKRKRKRVRKVDINKHVDKTKPTKKKKKQEQKTEISEEEIQRQIKETLTRLSGKGKSKGAKLRRAKRDSIAQKRMEEEAFAQLEEKILKITEFVTVSELASMMNVNATDVIGACMTLGIFASINQRLDAETIQLIADEYGYDVEFISAEIQEAIPEEEDREEDLVPRPPIVTVMGHVDHGKTSLLDRIRNANVTEKEAGGITQHIGAYSVTLKSGDRLTFLDTPGHEAFTAMRARGAQVTDIAVIIIAADDSVMPQTKEAIAHAQAAEVPMIFAINKIDVPGANPDKIKEQLSAMNILVEDWGGKYQCQEISAKKGVGIDDLLEKIILEAEILELKANPNRRAKGTVIEASLDKGKGYVTNMLVQTGTLKIGDNVLVGRNYGKVKAMVNEHGQRVKEAGPSTPVSVLGINGAPSAGDIFHIMEDEKEAKKIATKREQLYREQGLRTKKHLTLDEIGRRLAIGDFKELNLIIKGDVDGSIEAISDALLKLSTEQIQVNIIHKAVGAISEADVHLASASDAIIIGFQVRPSANVKKLAEQEQIDIRLYSVIYKVIDEVKEAMEGMLSPNIEEKVIGTAEVRETFHISKVGTIAGCFVTSGLIKRTSNIRVIRDGIVVHTGKLGSLKRFKDDVKEVKNNYECGLNIEGFNDIQVGDVIEAFEEVEVAKKL